MLQKPPLVELMALLMPAVNDTLVFLATSWAFKWNSLAPSGNVKEGLNIMVLGKNLPAFSKSILRNGQAYYL
jgi:hypothetical protein